jgi:hypothetical protein
MTDTARDYQTLTTADTNGLDDFFDVVPTPVDSLSVNVGTMATDDDIGEWITTSEAASSFKKSERTIQRYAKSGKLRSKTDESGRLMIFARPRCISPKKIRYSSPFSARREQPL